MRVLTLWQPWASLIAIGAKTMETRSWSTPYRGPLAIHAAARQPTAADYSVEITNALASAGIEPLREPLRAIVAVCELVDCVPAPQALSGRQNDAPFGDFSDGRFAWILDDVRPMSGSLLIAKGKLGLWEPSAALADSIGQMPHDAIKTR